MLGHAHRYYYRVCEIRKLIVNIGKSKVMRCSRYGNRGRMHVRINGEPVERNWIVSSTWDRQWQPMEVVEGMWYTE